MIPQINRINPSSLAFSYKCYKLIIILLISYMDKSDVLYYEKQDSLIYAIYKESSLKIVLTGPKDEGKRLYQIVITQNVLPEQFQQNQYSLEDVYNILKSMDQFQIQSSTGVIIFHIKGLKDQKPIKIDIPLKLKEPLQILYLQMTQEIQRLNQKIFNLEQKISKNQIEKNGIDQSILKKFFETINFNPQISTNQTDWQSKQQLRFKDIEERLKSLEQKIFARETMTPSQSSKIKSKIDSEDIDIDIFPKIKEFQSEGKAEKEKFRNLVKQYSKIQYHGNQYQGELKNRRPHGRGILFYEDGNKIEGNWKNGLKDGKCIYYWRNGDEDIEQYKDGYLHGQSISQKKNGSFIYRQYVDGQIHGIVRKYNLKDKLQYEAKYHDGEFEMRKK